eukprot:5799235-Prymnesium_polylepis.1
MRSASYRHAHPSHQTVISSVDLALPLPLSLRLVLASPPVVGSSAVVGGAPASLASRARASRSA